MNIRRDSSVVLVMVASAALTLTGCAGTTTTASTSAPATSASPTPSVSATATSSVTTPTTRPSHLPTSSPTLIATELVISPGELQAPGMAPLRVGTRLAPAAATSPLAVWDAAACAGTDVPGRWVGPFPGLFDPYSLWTDAGSGELISIRVTGAGPHLAEGIGVGSSLDELQKARPDARLIGTSSGDSDLWQISDAAGIVVIEVATDETYFGQPDGTILAMSILAAGDPHGLLADHAMSYYPAYEGDICG